LAKASTTLQKGGEQIGEKAGKRLVAALQINLILRANL
jgi:hypothetical protein